MYTGIDKIGSHWQNQYLLCLELIGGGTEKRGGQKKILKRGASWVKGWVP